MMFAAYIPSWSRLALSFSIQVPVILAVGFVVFLYARQRHSSPTVRRWLSIGFIFGTLAGLALAPWIDAGWRGPFSFFEVYRFQIAAVAGIVLGWLSLEAAAYFKRPRMPTA